jgi:hypothetical protein
LARHRPRRWFTAAAPAARDAGLSPHAGIAGGRHRFVIN